ncbi:MAG: PLP-dependent aminotransferase family protein [Thermogemmatispora sp.]|uniref:MocR-like pyridoxine biosynthesis transcription factor PdxR n=1 Tax=Thermogemmatispora sp. TaxID=1968838 RepID=UPI0019E47080|nr:PLP-dependent aminotransferase family protein [Thermogemmatispora sp.]MBE3566529.1 PLP-dependent aminotransferase family protein [Thermogemmatispora sp.]
MSITFSLDKSTRTLLYQQLAEQIKSAIVRGELTEGMQLPPVRRLAAELSVSTTTVAQAYDLLASEGIIGGHVGRGTYILSSPLTALARTRAPFGSDLQTSDPASICQRQRLDWAAGWLGGLSLQASRAGQLQWLTQRALERWGDPATMLNLSSGYPDVSLFPIERWERSMARAGRLLAEEARQAASLQVLQYGSTLGDEALRRYLCQYFTRFGFQPEPQEILLTSGNQQGLDLVARVLLAPGEPVFIEEPAYLAALDIFEQQRAACQPIPVDEEGLRLDLLEQALEAPAARPRLLCVVPTAHSPTGATMSCERRQQLVELARHYNLLIIEDDYCSELFYDESRSEPPPALRSFDCEGRVIYLKSFNKLIFPTLRLGCIVAAQPILARLVEGKQAFARGTSLPLARALLEHLSDPAFEEELCLYRQEYRRRRDALLNLLAEELAGLECRWTMPGAGFNLLLWLPPQLQEYEVIEKAADRGLLLAPGQLFRVENSQQQLPSVRLTFADKSPEQLREGVKRLSSTLRALLHGSSSGWGRASPDLFTAV